MVALTLLRRAGPARLVAGMRISSASSSFARPMVSRMSSGATSMNARALSGSARRFGCGTTDISISQELEELKYKQDSVTQKGDAKPEFLTNFLERGIWSINDVRGIDKVTISRKFGDENVCVVFSTVGGLQSNNEGPVSLPVMPTVSITKSTSPGELNIYLKCHKGKIIIEGWWFYDDTELDTELAVEERCLYTGPSFMDLDTGRKKELKKFLRKRGIDRSVALFIPEYAIYKEEQEYVRLLNNVKNFANL